ncbi:MAG: ribosome silencing factor [Chloroflexota bacterium]|nr:ribosome silencing factor [Chloroflexota bacterium]
MDSLELSHKIGELLLDKQGEDILILDLQEITTLTDYFVICSGNNRRQLAALAATIQEELKKSTGNILARGVEGTPDSGWILLDYNSIMVHLFTPEMRQYYQLEDLWNAAHVVAHIQ